VSAERPTGQWPAWMDDLLAYGPLAELEPEWRAEIGDAITLVLDERALALARARRQEEES
jgi:hypothetical protein